MNFKNYLLLFLLALSSNLYCQVYDFQSINQENGLPSSTITCVFQDSKNIIWMGTDGGGLVKYDGTNYTTYDKNKGLTGTFITSIVEDNNKNLIVSTNYNGIFIFDGIEFKNISKLNNPNLQSNNFFKLVKCTNKIICISDKEIITLNLNYQIKQLFNNDFLYSEINSAECDAEHTLYIAATNGLFKINLLEKNKFEKLSEKSTSITKSAGKKLFVGDENATIYSIENSSLKLFKSLKLNNYPITSIFLSKSGAFWIASFSQNSIKLLKNNELQSFDKSNSFDGYNVKCFFVDNSKNLYIGTSGLGLYKTHIQQYVGYKNNSFLYNNFIYSILKTDNKLFTATRNNGILEFNVDSRNNFKYLKTHNPNFSSDVIIKNNLGNPVFESLNGVSTIEDKIVKEYNLKKYFDGKVDIKAIHQDAKNRYFIGSWSKGLLIFDANFKFLKRIYQNKSFFANYVTTINSITNNSWYVGTNNGLYKLEETNNLDFKITKICNDVFSVATIDSFGNHWFAGSDCIYNINNKTNKIIKYDKKDGLTSTVIYTLIADKSNALLIGTNLGIDKVVINEFGKILSIKNYNSKNGFLGLETNMRAQFKADNGDIYLGTVKGLFKYISTITFKEEQLPKVVISGIEIFNQETNFNNKISNKWFNVPKENYVFKSNENQLTFKFGLINNESSIGALYSYKLEGTDKKWSNPTTLNEVTYSNLKFGKYTFKIKLVNNLGKTINEENNYSFSVEAPIYYKWWFIITIFGFFIAILYLISNRTKKFNSEFVKNYSQENSIVEQSRLFILYFGILLPVTEVVIEIFNVRVYNSFTINIIGGLLLLLYYFLSTKLEFFRKNTTLFVGIVFICYNIFIIFKIISNTNEKLFLLEFAVLLFFSFSVFKKTTYYWIYSTSIILGFIILNIYNYIPLDLLIILINVIIAISLINYAKYISFLNNNDKFLFANQIVNKGNTLTIATNKKGELTFCSEQIKELLGYTQEEVKGLNFWKLTDDATFNANEYYNNYQEGTLYTKKLKGKNGEYKYFQFKDKQFSEDLIISNGQDVTEQISIQNKYINLVENAKDIIYELDAAGNYTFINKYAQKTMEYTTDELKKMNFSELVRVDFREKITQFYANPPSDSNEYKTVEFPALTKSGKTIWLSQNVIIKRNERNDIIGFSSIARDVSLIKTLEIDELRRQKKSKRYNEVIKQLTVKSFTNQEDFDSFLDYLLKIISKTVDVNRASYWKYSKQNIVCKKLFDLNKNASEENLIIDKNSYPIYYNAIEIENVIVASEVQYNKDVLEFKNNYFEDNNIKSILHTAIFLNGKLEGILFLESNTKIKNWDNEDINFSKSISDFIAIAVETNTRIEAEKSLEYKSEILVEINTVTKNLLTSKNSNEIIEGTLEKIGKVTNVDKLSFFEYNDITKIFSQKYRWNAQTNSLTELNEKLLHLPKDNFTWILNEIQKFKIFCSVVSKIPDEEIKKFFISFGIKSMLILPIYVKDEMYGILFFNDSTIEREWSTDEIVILSSLANNISTSIERNINEKIIFESEEKFKLIANNIPGTVFLSKFDENYTKVYINDEIETLTGYPKEDFLYHNLSFISLIHPDQKSDILVEQYENLNNGKQINSKYQIKRKDGNYVWIEEYADAIKKDGEIEYIGGIFIDITKQKEAEDAIKAKDYAVTANKAKSDFLANMSHEIRTPLNGIIGFTDLLKNTKLEKIQKNYMNTINQSALSLLEIVNDILDFSKIESGKLELDIKKYNLLELTSEVIELIKYDSNIKNINLQLNIESSIPNYIYTDSLRLKQILINLLSNAVKFTENGNVTLKISILEKIDFENYKLRFSVLDTGIGIKDEYQKIIFEAFSQGDNSTTRKFGGTGLGLTISNQLLGLMNSQLQLKSEYETGSEFYFDINILTTINPDEAIHTPIIHKPEKINNALGHESYKILLVEDNKINMLLAKTLVKQIIPNCSVYEAVNGKEAVEKFQIIKPDLVLMDIQMPFLNGYEATAAIRKLEIGKHTPIIALTAGTIIGEKEKCLEAGMDDYTSKPIIKEIFEAIIIKWITI